MKESNPEENALSIISDINARIKDLDEKNNFLKEKMILLSQSFLKQENELTKELAILKDEIQNLRDEIDRIKEGVNHIIHESAAFARKEELKVLERYIKLWEPLKCVKEDEVKKMIDDALKKRLKKIF